MPMKPFKKSHLLSTFFIISLALALCFLTANEKHLPLFESLHNIARNTLEIIYFAAQSLLILQLYHLTRQLKSDHDRSRREMAITLNEHWSYSDKFIQLIVVKRLINSFDSDSRKKVMIGESFNIDIKHKTSVEACLIPFQKEYGYSSESLYSTNDRHITICETGSTMLRQMIVSYFNRLECICTAYRHNVADRDIIAEQFLYLSLPAYEVEHMITLLNLKDSFPGILYFINNIKYKTTDGKAKTA